MTSITSKSAMANFSDILFISRDPEDLFTLLYLLNKNNSIKIYKAIHNETREIYAIKMISLSNVEKSANTKSLFNKIHEEILLLNIINKCEYFVKYYGSYISHKSNCIWLIYEYCPCGSLFDLMVTMNKTFNEKEISIIISMLLHALIFLHQINIIHKNIQISNILLQLDGTVKLNNFNKII